MGDKPDNEIRAMEAVYGALGDLDSIEQTRVIEWVQQKLGLVPSPGAQNKQGIPASGNLGVPSQVRGTTPKAFVAEKRPRTDVERVACLAYYLTHQRNITKFKTKDLTELNKEAAQPKMSNAAFAVTNATNSAYLAAAGSGQKQITARGEAVVMALPDDARVKEALKAYPTRGRRRKTGKARTK
jgi:hypothetical protein